jgi:hypothetical protein
VPTPPNKLSICSIPTSSVKWYHCIFGNDVYYIDSYFILFFWCFFFFLSFFFFFVICNLAILKSMNLYSLCFIKWIFY